MAQESEFDRPLKASIFEVKKMVKRSYLVRYAVPLATGWNTSGSHHERNRANAQQNEKDIAIMLAELRHRTGVLERRNAQFEIALQDNRIERAVTDRKIKALIALVCEIDAMRASESATPFKPAMVEQQVGEPSPVSGNLSRTWHRLAMTSGAGALAACLIYLFASGGSSPIQNLSRELLALVMRG